MVRLPSLRLWSFLSLVFSLVFHLFFSRCPSRVKLAHYILIVLLGTLNFGCLDTSEKQYGTVALSSVGCTDDSDVITPPPGIPASFVGSGVSNGDMKTVRFDPAIMARLLKEQRNSVWRDRRRVQMYAQQRTFIPSTLTLRPSQPLSVNQDRIPAGTRFVAVIDYACLRDRNPDDAARTISGKIFATEIKKENLPERSQSRRLRAHLWQPSDQLTQQDVRALSENDSCLTALSLDTLLRHADTTPDDTYFGDQTHMNAIRAPAAYDTFYNSSTGISSDVVLAVIDDGVELTHSDLAANIWTNPGEVAGNGIDDDGNGYVDDLNGYNFASNLSSPAPQGTASHGTHVAGLAAARGENTLGVSGVIGYNVKIMALNVFGPSAGASTVQLINALQYASEMGADIINLSLGGTGLSGALQGAVRDAVAGGAVVVAAAGNDGTEINGDFVPASYASDIRGMLSVASLDADDQTLSYFSNYSSVLVELGAPGSSSSQGGLLSTVPGNAYGYKQGTSMATPVVAGAVGLALSLIRSRGASADPADIESYLKVTSPQLNHLSGAISGCRSLDLKSLADTLEEDF